MAKRTIKINIKLPNGVTATDELVNKATKAAKDAINDTVGELSQAQRLADELAKKGVSISAEEILARKTGAPAKKGARRASTKTAKKAKKSGGGRRKRTVLGPDQKKALIDDLKNGATGPAAAKKYGVSHATVMNLKREAGLTKPRESK